MHQLVFIGLVLPILLVTCEQNPMLTQNGNNQNKKAQLPVHASPAWESPKQDNQIQITSTTRLKSNVQDGCGNDCYQPALVTNQLGQPNKTNASGELHLNVVPIQNYKVSGFVVTSERILPNKQQEHSHQQKPVLDHSGPVIERASTKSDDEPQIVSQQHIECNQCALSNNCPSQCLVKPQVMGSNKTQSMKVIPDQTKEEAKIEGAPNFRFAAQSNQSIAPAMVPALVMSTECQPKVCGDNCPAHCKNKLAPGIKDVNKLKVHPVHDKPTLVQTPDGKIKASAGDTFSCHCLAKPICPCRPTSLLQVLDNEEDPKKGETVLEKEKSSHGSTTLKSSPNQNTAKCDTTKSNCTTTKANNDDASKKHTQAIANSHQVSKEKKSNATLIPALISSTKANCDNCGTNCPVECKNNIVKSIHNNKMTVSPVMDSAEAVVLTHEPTNTPGNCKCLKEPVCSCRMMRFAEVLSIPSKPTSNSNNIDNNNNNSSTKSYTVPALIQGHDCHACGTNCPSHCTSGIPATQGVSSEDLKKLTVVPKDDTSPLRIEGIHGCKCINHPKCACRTPALLETKNSGNDVKQLKGLLNTVHRIGHVIGQMKQKKMKPTEALRFVSLHDQVKKWEQPKKFGQRALHKALLQEESRADESKEVRPRTVEWGKKVKNGKGKKRLPYTLLPNEPPKTSLTNGQVDKVARIVLSDAHHNKCAGTHEYSDLSLHNCNKKQQKREKSKGGGKIDRQIKAELKARKKHVTEKQKKNSKGLGDEFF